MAEKEKPKSKAGKDEAVTRIRDRFSESSSASEDNRKNYVEDIRFSCAEDQWTEEAKKLRGKNRPALTFNRLNGVIKQIIGDYRQNKLSIKVLPANGEASEEMADIIAGIIRNIEAQSNADMAYTTALDCACRGGFGDFRIVPEYCDDDVFDQDLRIRPIHNPLTVYWDPAARLITREDADWCILTETISKEEFKRLYPKASTKGFDDKGDGDWFGEDGVRVAEQYEKVRYTARLAAFSNGMVMEITDDKEIAALAQIGITLVQEREATRTKIAWQKVSGSEVLDEREYKTRYIPVIHVPGEEVNVEGKVITRSAIFYAKDAQRTYNYSKTTAVELTALAPKSPWLVTPKQIQGFQQQWNNANTSPLPYLVYNFDEEAGKPDQMQPRGTPSAEITQALGAADDIKATTGIYDASLGARSNETSGRAIAARQQEGDTATFIFLDNLKEGIQHCGRVLIDWLPLVYDAERVVRVLDMEGNPQTEVVNQQKHDPMTGITMVLNSLAVGKYDVLVEAGPSFASRRAEALNGMVQLAQAYPQVMELAGDLIVKNMDWPGAEEISARLKRSMPPQITTDPDSPEAQQQAAQLQQQQQEQQQVTAQLEKGKIDAENAKSQATIAKAHAEVVKAHADVAQSAEQGHQERQESTQQPPKVSQPTQAPVTIQFNAEHALNGIGEQITGMAEQQGQSVAQMLEVIQHVLATTAQSTQLIAASLQGQQQIQIHQVESMKEMASQNAAAMNEVAEAIKTQTAVMAAPRVAVRDGKGNIVASEVRREIAGHV